MRQVLGVLGLVLLLASGVAQAASEEEAVRLTFQDYRAALQDKQGDIAAFLVTPETLNFYAAAAKAAVYAMPDELAQMPLVQQLLALRLREAIPGERLQDMGAEDLVARSVTEGIVNPDGLRDLTLGPIEVEGDVALAPQVDPWGRDIGVTWRFRKVQDTWRIDLRPSLMAANTMLLAMQQERRLSREDLLLGLVSGSVGRRIDRTIFIPPAAHWKEPEAGGQQ